MNQLVKRLKDSFAIYADITNGIPYMFYDIIFEFEEWKMEAQSVDNNSQK